MRIQRLAKQVLDRILAFVLLVLLTPLLAVVVAWILVDCGRPVFFVYPRAGRFGRPFPMLKFRTMIPDAIEVGRTQKLSEDPFGLVPGDPRITRSGRFLRRTSLDELPQLLNVVRGEMSLVGPRPDLVEQASHYSEHDRQRLDVLPGITGWSQIHGRDEIEWPERIEQDLWYMAHWSLWLDLRILVATARQLFREEPTPIEDAVNIERARQARERS
jgi:lipopolysaccharide/colanic/teichoic acid biosynthesis glycosyltransferase